MAKPKIFGIGMHRTGTTSLREALPMLGFDTLPPWRWTGRYADTLKPKSVLTDAFNLAARYEAAAYMPVMTNYKELYARYPDAKFILTERPEKKWLKSMIGYFGGQNWPEVRLAFGVDARAENADILLEKYRAHNKAVKEFFADKPGSLLVMDISKGHGWKELCGFLGVPEPDAPYPRANARGSLYAQFVMHAIPVLATLRDLVTNESASRMNAQGPKI